MKSRAGVGYSEAAGSFDAGAEAARAALTALEGARCDLVLLFSTSKHDPAALREGVRSVVGAEPRLLGGYAVGVITNHQLGYDGFQVGVAAISLGGVKLDMYLERGLPGREHEVGVALGRQVAGGGHGADASAMLFYDSVNRTSGRLKLNMATPLLRGMAEVLPAWPSLVGAGLVGDMQCRETRQWFDGAIEQHSAAALVLSGGVRMDTLILHGCKPASDYHRITKTDGHVVLEIDERPALDVIGELLGKDSNKSWREYSFFVTLGVNKGEKYGPYREDDYANRLCLGVDKERRGLVMFEPDLVPGQEFQLMGRSLDFEYVSRRTTELLARVEGRQPFFAFYIDCAGRAAAYSGMEEEEAAEVQRALGDRIPLLGLYSGVEIAKVGRDLQALDWTGVLCILSN
jgi:hypothetical protein